MKYKKGKLWTTFGLAALLATMLAPAIMTGASAAGFAPVKSLTPTSAGKASSVNWAGFALNSTAGTVTSVKGSWVQPKDTQTCAPKALSAVAFWVGIDGFSDSTVEQLGTGIQCYNAHIYYYAWLENFPAATKILPIAIHPGDKISAGVSYSGGSFHYFLTDASTGKTFTYTATVSHAERSSAEWIAESPFFLTNSGFPIGLAILPNFGSVSFSGAYATVSGHTGKLGSFGSIAVQINAIDFPIGPVKLLTSPIASDGTSFSVTWKSPGPYANS